VKEIDLKKKWRRAGRAKAGTKAEKRGTGRDSVSFTVGGERRFDGTGKNPLREAADHKIQSMEGGQRRAIKGEGRKDWGGETSPEPKSMRARFGSASRR